MSAETHNSFTDEAVKEEPIELVSDSFDEEQDSSSAERSSAQEAEVHIEPPAGEPKTKAVSEPGEQPLVGAGEQPASPDAASEAGSELVSVDIAKSTNAGSTPCGDPTLSQSKSQPPETHQKTVGPYFENFKVCFDWLWNLRAPLAVLLGFALCPKLILLWILIVLAKPITVWVYKHFPAEWKTKIHGLIPSTFKDSTMVRDLGEGADQGLPFILFWLYLCCAPFALVWIALHWVRGFFQKPKAKLEDGEGFVFIQNKRPDAVRSETTFYYSRAFGLVVFAFFAMGIPAFFSYNVYEKMGIERLMKTGEVLPVRMYNGSRVPTIEVPPVGLASVQKFNPKRIQLMGPQGSDVTWIQGYNGFWPWISDLGIEPNKRSVFFVHFYLVSLATALCLLFFRAWFLFPLNFLTDEHDVEITASGIKKKMLKSWFLSVITINRWTIGGGPDSLKWNEVKSLRRMEEGYFKLSPLPETAFKKESLSYKILNKFAALIDGIAHKSAPGNYLIFSSSEKTGDFGRNIKINLNDLSREQRARLFYSVKKWAPDVVIHESAEKQLLGSTVLKDKRYTQLWFDVLTYRSRVKKHNVLPAGEILKNGAYRIEDRISSGGQATTYIATKENGEKCVLKEFILATSTSSAPIESAREFEAEVSLLSQLQHPGIVRLEDFFFEEGRVYVAMEYIEGVTLRQKIQQQGRLSEAEVIQIAHSVCDVLEYLHGQNPPIVHRDVTPENILVKADGTIKLIDFSLAVRQDGQKTTDSCAKQCFTPPEQFREEACVQSDIYALGATMYFLLTGLTPKPISTSSPRAKVPQVSEEMNAVVERATRLDLNVRYESVYWLKLDLANFSKSNPTNHSSSESSNVSSNPAP